MNEKLDLDIIKLYFNDGLELNIMIKS